ncbi:MAG: uracil-DNA glycosylase family protein [Pyrinomonadaceae bacterium]|nr:uracil-DNA glycosylase family protein [Pyrinomonadaceae bacterium]
MMDAKIEALIKEIRACTNCAENLPLGPRPIVSFSGKSKVLLVGQAPGTKVHETGVPWNDPSGDRLRAWLQVSRDEFYDTKNFAIAPMGFCYPGRGKSGDNPPRPECAPLWMERITASLTEVQMTILIGQYALNYFLGERRKKTLTETVKNWREYFPNFVVLPHPSPRNNIWLKKNEWFEKELVPELSGIVSEFLK